MVKQNASCFAVHLIVTLCLHANDNQKNDIQLFDVDSLWQIESHNKCTVCIILYAKHFFLWVWDTHNWRIIMYHNYSRDVWLETLKLKELIGINWLKSTETNWNRAASHIMYACCNIVVWHLSQYEGIEVCLFLLCRMHVQVTLCY